MHTASRPWFVGVAAWSLCAALAAQQAPVKVFVLAGQSNMEGKARDELWERQAIAEETAEFFAPFRRNGNKNWVVREDVFVKFFDRRGPLTLGYGSPQRSGCEFAFGLRIGDALEAPALLIKTAWVAAHCTATSARRRRACRARSSFGRSSRRPCGASRSTTRRTAARTRCRRCRTSPRSTARATAR